MPAGGDCSGWTKTPLIGTSARPGPSGCPQARGERTGAPLAWILPVGGARGAALSWHVGSGVGAPCMPFPAVGSGMPACRWVSALALRVWSGLSILNREGFHKALETRFWELNNNQGFFPLSPGYKQTKPLHCSKCWIACNSPGD